MVTHYESDINRWEDWEKAYRFGVFLIFPPDPLQTQVNTLRATYDPRSQSTCGAHISLTIPLPGPLNETHWKELEAIASRLSPITVHYGPLMSYLPHPGVCLAIEPQAELDGLRAALEATSAFAGAPPRRYPFSAHMTVAEFISVERTKALMHELKDVVPEGVFTCPAVSYAVPDGDFHFTERRRLALAHRASA